MFGKKPTALQKVRMGRPKGSIKPPGERFETIMQRLCGGETFEEIARKHSRPRRKPLTNGKNSLTKQAVYDYFSRNFPRIPLERRIPFLRQLIQNRIALLGLMPHTFKSSKQIEKRRAKINQLKALLNNTAGKTGSDAERLLVKEAFSRTKRRGKMRQ